jgi:hypothetical protein
MKKKLHVLFFILLLLPSISFAVLKTWIGGAAGTWSVGTNWSGGTAPGSVDDVEINNTTVITMNVSPVINSLKISGNNIVELSAASLGTITISSTSAITPGLFIDAASTLRISQSTANSFRLSLTGNAGVTGRIFGALIFSGTNAAAAASFDLYTGPLANANVIVYNTGIIQYNANSGNTGSIATSLEMEAGSQYIMQKNGGTIPAATYKNGSIIRITGVTNAAPSFSSSGSYNGVVEWNCTSQTVSGGSATLLPTPSYTMDSIRVINTGTGTLRITTQPNNYTLGHVEVQGGTLEMGAPSGLFGAGNITTALKISGGIVYVNATFTGDGVNAYGLNVFVGGQFTITGGTLNLTNRPTGSLGGGRLNVAGDVLQTGPGVITATTNLGSQNQLVLNSTTAQNLTMNTFTGPMALVTDNTSTAGITLLSNLNIQSFLIFNTGVINTTAAKLLTFSAGGFAFGASNNSYVNGPVKKIGNTAFDFPVGKPLIGYVPISISAPAVATDAFTAEYVRGSAVALGPVTATGLDHVSRVDYWTLNRDAGTSAVDVTLNWTAESSNNGSPNYITNLQDLTIAHFNGTSWDAYYHSPAAATGNTTAGSLTWPGVTAFSPFSLGSINLGNPLPVNLNYLNGIKQNGIHNIAWKVTCTNNPNVTMALERSADNRNFTGINTSVADPLRCQQPFAYSDNAPLPGINYYRLKMTDDNGKITYSNVIAILNKDAGFDIVGLLPTIVKNNALLNVTAAQKTKMQVVVTDIAGRQVQKIGYNLIAGSNQFIINLSNLSAGTYQITGYTEEGKSGTIRFVKQ